MKKWELVKWELIYSNILLLFVLGITILAGYITSPMSAPNTRTEVGTLINLGDTNTARIYTEDGNVWEMSSPGRKNGNVLVVFNTMGTENVEDDRIDCLL